METTNFKALVVEEHDGKFTRTITKRSINDLPENELLIMVHYSSINYKDALSASGNKGVTRKYPHTPGIDAVGTVVFSKNKDFAKNDEVIVTSFDLGMNTPGGFGQYISVPADWAIKIPDGISQKESMIIGTAGLTAGMSVLKLGEKVGPADGTIVVSGATGGVGALSVNILAKLGYRVAAVSSKENEHDFLTGLGADEIISRFDFEKPDARPILKGRFAGAVDTVGGPILENIIKYTRPLGLVTCCGNVASPVLNTSIFPFILRGISLIGIDSQNCPLPERKIIWNKLAGPWKPEKLMDLYTEINLDGLNEKLDLILQGKLKGRTIVNMYTS